LEDFIKLGIAQPIIDALAVQGYETPTPIQQQAIPPALEHRDLLGTAQTGTGKTAAFSIPIIQHLMDLPNQKRLGISALILTPTRELALQIDESIRDYSLNIKLKHVVIFGGVKQAAQVNAIKHGVDIMTATPGRLLDLMQQGYIDLRHITHFVLDEADRMLDMGFINDVKKVIAKLPVKRQTLFFSATMPNEVVKLSQSILVDPVRVSVAPVSTTAEKVTQKLYFVDQKNKKFLLRDLLRNTEIEIPSVLVFTRTKHGADKVVKDLVSLDIVAQAIHGNKSQAARQNALSNFKNRTTRVLVATDIAARGIDIDELTHVINYEIPNIPETYVHRIGRTGRAGNSGVAWSFVDREEVPFLKDIQKLIKMEIERDDDHNYGPGVQVKEEKEDKPYNRPPQRIERKIAANKKGNGGGDRGRNDRGGNDRGGSGNRNDFRSNDRPSAPRDNRDSFNPAPKPMAPKPDTSNKPKKVWKPL
jgi:ATP-dependent RNA helicase RhlE